MTTARLDSGRPSHGGPIGRSGACGTSEYGYEDRPSPARRGPDGAGATVTVSGPGGWYLQVSSDTARLPGCFSSLSLAHWLGGAGAGLADWARPAAGGCQCLGASGAECQSATVSPAALSRGLTVVSCQKSA